MKKHSQTQVKLNQMKNKILILVTAIILMAIPKENFGQVVLGPDASKFVLFTTSGAIDDNLSATSHITGNIGTNTAAGVTDFGNIDGVMHPGADLATAAADVDLLSTIGQIDALPIDFVGPLSLGSGDTLTPGVWSIPGNATLTLELVLDAEDDPDAQFIIRIAGTFNTNSLSEITLINGALACNVFWKIDGAVTMASLSGMRGNIISGGAFLVGSGSTLEGRMFSTPAGAITIDNITARKPIGCSSPVLTGPPAPELGSLDCFTIFSSDGALDGNSSSTSIGDVGNAGGGSVIGWSAGDVTGTLHSTGDPATMLAALDLIDLYDSLNIMPHDIELEFPVLLGRDLVLTPHVYLINSSVNGPATLTDTITLNAQGNPNAVFVFKIINGALTTSVASVVKLINGAQAKNVFWMIDGATSINNNSTFRGTIVISSGSLNLVNTGIILEGRAFTQVGAITTAGMAATMTPGCGGFEIITDPEDTIACEGSSATFSVTAANATGYQWMEDKGSGFNDLAESSPYSGVNTSVLTIDPVDMNMDGYDYQVIVSGTSGDIYSDIATLTVNPSESITGTTDNSVCGPDSVELEAAASGGTINWFADSTGGLSLETGDTFTTPVISETDTFYVETTFESCTSEPRVMVIATVNPVYETNNPQEICDGESYEFNGNIYTIEGDYNDTLTTIEGCDSVIVTELTVHPVYETNNPQEICEGESYEINGNIYTIEGDYNDTLTTVEGCDSVIVTELTVHPVYETSNPQEICEGDSYEINGSIYTVEGDYNDTLTTVEGCDSVVVTQLSVIECGGADLGVVKTVDIEKPFIGRSVVFTIVATNHGHSDATGVTVTDILQSGYKYISSTTTKGVYVSSTGIWTIDSLENGDSETLTITATVNSTGSYDNTALIEGNELDTNSLNDISVVETFPMDFFIPEGFSPNADGINDLFVIRGIQFFPENSFVIFNRWGNKVYETENYQNTWDGKATMGLIPGGDDLPVGTYFYLLDLKNDTDIFKGTIYLNR